MAKYPSLRATAQRLIQKNGRDITYRQKGATLTDPAKPWEGTTAASNKDSTVKASFVSITEQEIRGQLVKTGDKRVLIAADDLPCVTPPSSADTILDRGIAWNIVSVEAIDPSEAAVLYDFHVRA